MTADTRTLITNAVVVVGDQLLHNGELLFGEGRILSVGKAGSHGADAAATVIDAGHGYVLPGFIDVHVHGGYGHDFMNADAAGLDEITRFHARHGTTAMLATTVTAPREAIVSVLQQVSAYMKRPMPYAQLIGVHLEGPFISEKWPGAQNPKYIVPPQKAWLEEWLAAYPGVIRLLTMAPEKEGALDFIEWLTGQGVIVAAGHTDAGYDDIERAVERGLSHAVHTFNAMTGLHHRKPGTVGAVLTDDRIVAEVIADGFHVHPAAIRVLARTKPKDKLVLITDAISAAGLGNGLYDLGGLAVVVQDGVARLKDGDSLAGSTLTMIGAFKFAVTEVGLPVGQASVMASGNPARQLGIFDRTGSLEAGKQADILLVSPDFRVERVWIKGEELNMEN